jgi:hypothetical protein
MYYNAFSGIRQPLTLALGGLLFGFLLGDLAAVGFASGVDKSSLGERDHAASGARNGFGLRHCVSLLFKYVL